MNKLLLLLTIILLMTIQRSYSQAAFSIRGNYCYNSTLEFVDETVIDISSRIWNFGDGTTSTEKNPTHVYADTGNYTVTLTVTTNTGSSFSTTEDIRIYQNPVARFITDSITFFYSTYSRIFIDTSTYFNTPSKRIWSFGDLTDVVNTDSVSVLYKYKEKGTYNVWLKIIDQHGCTDSVNNTIEIHDRYYVPNVFTPNDDKINDFFIITSNGVTLFSIEIYSRWGNRVFKRSGHEQIVWDGRMSDGSLVQPGTYFYVITGESGNITYEPETGYVTVFY
jgi:gliding motility-associated-like protein